jgi:hypothetical protein
MLSPEQFSKDLAEFVNAYLESDAEAIFKLYEVSYI